MKKDDSTENSPRDESQTSRRRVNPREEGYEISSSGPTESNSGVSRPSRSLPLTGGIHMSDVDEERLRSNQPQCRQSSESSETDDEGEKTTEHHKDFVKRFREIWKKYNQEGSLWSIDENVDTNEPKFTRNSPDSHSDPDNLNRTRQSEKGINAFEKWLSENPKIQNSSKKVGEDGRTVLHYIVTRAKITESHISLFDWVMKACPYLYKEGDEQDATNTVLQMAIKKKRPRFVECLLKRYPKQTVKLIEFNQSLIYELIPMMIDKECSEPILSCLGKEVLFHVDGGENSPLHLAAKYGRLVDPCQPHAQGNQQKGPANLADNKDPQQRIDKQLKLIEGLLERYPEAIIQTNKAGQSAYQYRIRTFYERFKPDHLDLGYWDEPEELHDDKIMDLLKDKIMHLNERDKIIHLLHGNAQKREIHFDLLELANLKHGVSESALRRLIEGLKFESILKYVRIPSYTLSTASNGTGLSNSRRKEQQLVGKGDFQLIFNLLKLRGVKKIISINVDDDDESPHSDEAIEKVAPFDIEEWDWRRVDLCSSVIYTAAKNARKIFLYSSGNNAVLHSWSAVDGLNRFEKLTDVYIFVQQRLESEDRIKRYLDNFERRLKGHKPHINIYPRIQSGINFVSDQLYYPGEDKVDTNVWLENMYKFAGFIKNLQDPTRDVKVAVVDDGVDKLLGNFEDSVIAGVSFYASHGGFRTWPHYFSSNGHGTLMAQLIRRICPKAKLYIARLDQGINGEPTIESAIKAISWATTMRVDIISMSWTFSELDQNSEKNLRGEIEKAHNANILTFASASDQGFNHTSKSYPGNIPGVFCIGAAKTSGMADDAALRESHFVFPGGSAGLKSPRRTQTNAASNSDIVFGSSFATAVASGLAALILCCVEICGLGDEYRDLLQQHERMQDVFQGMAGTPKPSYIEAEKYFPSRFADKTLEDEEDIEDFRRIVERIIR
ncbi:MAG: hypothetical protein M1834_000758 [Cirrosporium novae-zelandiae]|nr:MAG: hypothetical protein M1834_000758 [Cirrosporium novae-zelandiae]